MDYEIYVGENVRFHELKMSFFNLEAMCHPKFQLEYLRSINKKTFHFPTLTQFCEQIVVTNAFSRRPIALKHILGSCSTQDKSDKLTLLNVERDTTEILSHDDT